MLRTVLTTADVQRVLFSIPCSPLWRLGGGPIAGDLRAPALVIIHELFKCLYIRLLHLLPIQKNDYSAISTELGTLFQNSQRDTMVRGNCMVTRIVLLVVTFNTLMFSAENLVATADEQSGEVP